MSKEGRRVDISEGWGQMMVGREVVGGCHLRGHLPGYPWCTIPLVCQHYIITAGAPCLCARGNLGWAQGVAPGDGPHSRIPLAHKNGAPLEYSYCWRTTLVRQG
jgi:hypothetical protein